MALICKEDLSAFLHSPPTVKLRPCQPLFPQGWCQQLLLQWVLRNSAVLEQHSSNSSCTVSKILADCVLVRGHLWIYPLLSHLSPPTFSFYHSCRSWMVELYRFIKGLDETSHCWLIIISQFQFQQQLVAASWLYAHAALYRGKSLTPAMQ